MLSVGQQVVPGFDDEDPFGDPALLEIPSVGQMLAHYVLLVPPGWTRDILTLGTYAGNEIVVDGEPLSETSCRPIAQSWLACDVPVDDGVHELVGTQAFSVAAWGYDSYDSYAYRAGHALLPLSLPPPQG